MFSSILKMAMYMVHVSSLEPHELLKVLSKQLGIKESPMCSTHLKPKSNIHQKELYA
jgi:hypothetical protein